MPPRRMNAIKPPNATSKEFTSPKMGKTPGPGLKLFNYFDLDPVIRIEIEC